MTIPEPELDAALKLVGARIEHIMAQSDPLVLKYLADVSKSRGKRIRPQLMLVTASLFGQAKLDSVVNCAACCELLHSASLIHDDVIDEADLRRGMATLNCRYGNEIAVVVGDVLALLLHALNEERDFELTGMLLNTSQHLGLGVIEEVLNRNNFQLSVEKYYEVIYYKTAALFSLCLGLGAYLGGADAAAVALAQEYGKQLGLGFQVVDDLLDVVQDAAVTGKPAFSDLREGRITLPYIHALATAPQETKRLVEAYQDGAAETAVGAISEHLARAGSIDFAFAAAQSYIAAAHTLGLRLAQHAPAPQYQSGLERIEARILSALPATVTVSA